MVITPCAFVTYMLEGKLKQFIEKHGYGTRTTATNRDWRYIKYITGCTQAKIFSIMPTLPPNASFQSVPFRQHFLAIVISSIINALVYKRVYMHMEFRV